MIILIPENASWVRILQNPNHINIIWDILSYETMTKDRYSHRIERVTRSFLDRRSNKFGHGLFTYVTGELKKQNIPYKISHEKLNKSMKIRKESSLNVESFIEFDKITLEDYQNKVVSILDKGIKRGCIQASTGSGKSILAGAIIAKLGIPKTLIIVPTKSIANGFRKELQKLLNIDIGLMSGEEKTVGQVTIGLYQTIRNINLKQVNKEIDCVIVDEAHGSKCSSILHILQQLPNVWYRFGFSATFPPKTNRQDWFAITSQLGEIIIKISDEEAKERVVPVEAYMLKYKTKTKYKDFQDIYRNDLLLSEERCEYLLQLVDYALDNVNNCLLLVDEYEQAKLIKEVAEANYFITPEIAWSGSKNLDKIADDLNNERIQFVIATPVWKVGTNIPNVQSLVLGSVRKSSIDTIQKIGRIRRKVKGKDVALVFDIYDIIDNYSKIEEFSKKRLSIYKKKKWFRGFLE